MTITQSAVDLGRELVAALAARDWDAVERCLAPDVDFHAVVPGEGSYRAQSGAADTVAQFRKWYGALDEHELLESDVHEVVDRLYVRYRFGVLDEDGWQVVEQHGFARVGESGIEKLDLLCSGFRPVAARPQRP